MDKIILDWLSEKNLLNREKLTEKYGETDVLESISKDFEKSEEEYKKRKKLLEQHGWIISLLEIDDEEERFKMACYIDNHSFMHSIENLTISDIENSNKRMNTSDTLSLSLKVLKQLKGNYKVVNAPRFLVEDGKKSLQIPDIEMNFIEGLPLNLEKGFKEKDKELENFIVNKVYEFLSDKKNLYIYSVIQSVGIFDDSLLVRLRVLYDDKK